MVQVLILSENWQKKRAAEEAKPVGSPQRSESIIATAKTNIEVCTFSSLAVWCEKKRWNLAPTACVCNVAAVILLLTAVAGTLSSNARRRVPNSSSKGDENR